MAGQTLQTTQPPATTHHELASPSGLTFRFAANGRVADIECDPLRLNLLSGNAMDVGTCNLFLRVRKPSLKSTDLLGPGGPGSVHFSQNAFVTTGSWEGIGFSCQLSLASRDTVWFWDVRLHNECAEERSVDLFHVQDVGLDPNSTNPAYVSQYIDHTVLSHPEHGPVVCCRQNQRTPVGHPWLMLGSCGRASGVSTDGFQFYGLSYKETGIPEGLLSEGLPGRRQYEFSMPAFQEDPITLAPHGHARRGFFAVYRADHPEPSSANDLALVAQTVALFNEEQSQSLTELKATKPEARSLFETAPLLAAEDLTEDELTALFGSERRCAEHNDGHRLSFFCGEDRHVALRRKELLVERPHGHILKTGHEWRPDETVMSSTAFAYGVFSSQLTQGNTRFHRMLTTSKSPLNLLRSTGQRVFVKLDGAYRLLGVPSAFEVSPNACRWIYKYGAQLLQLRTWASPDEPTIHFDAQVLHGEACELILSHSLHPDWSFAATSGSQAIELRPVADSEIACKLPDGRTRLLPSAPERIRRLDNDALLFNDGQRQGLPFLVIETEPIRSFGLQFSGELVQRPVGASSSETAPTGDASWSSDRVRAWTCWRQVNRHLDIAMPSGPEPPALAAIREILPWFAQNAAVHFVTPYGLEQSDGAAWGTRDVCQGPMEMLLALERYEEARNVLCRVFTAQNPDGDWPQWFMFDRYREERAADAHGDIVFWPIMALTEYIRATGDCKILEEDIPFHAQDDENVERGPLTEHVERALSCVLQRFVPNTHLVAYGEGDWNDSMQPADHSMKERLVSSWTVALSFQTLSGYADVCRRSGKTEKAQQLERLCAAIGRDFNDLLVRDGVVAGYGHLQTDSGVRHLLHPADEATGIRYRLLPMIRGIISGLFTLDQARSHLKLIEAHLKGPDGARLMDCPVPYSGGLQRRFQRAESSSFFGREIGIMYMHAHLRYAEALARVGHAAAFLAALRQAVPIDIQTVVPSADFRQSNCYYSSSDAAFDDRYRAAEDYAAVRTGRVALKGGWRVYSSGPGIFLRLVYSQLLGLRHRYGQTILDPVVSPDLNGLTARQKCHGRDTVFVYHVARTGHGPQAIRVNGRAIEFCREEHPYREGGAIVADSAFTTALNRDVNTVDIDLS